MTDDTSPDPTPDAAKEPSRPVLRVVNPDATPEEIAALVAVFSAMGGEPAPTRRPVRVWSNPARLVRTTHRAGPGGWRASGMPG